MNDLQLHELLDSYVDKRISYRQLQGEIEQSMAGADVASLAQQHAVAVAAVDQFALLQSIKKVRTQYQAQAVPLVQMTTPATVSETPVVGINWVRRMVAVAAVFFAGLALWSMVTLSGYSKDEMYADFNEGYSLNTVRSNAVLAESDLVEAFRAGNYASVVQLYEAGKQHTPREMFFAGYAYMQTEDYTNAAVNLENLLQANAASGQQLYNDDAEYYLALCRMQLGNYESAYQIMKRIYAQPAHTYNSNVSMLQLAKLWWLK